MAIDYVVDYACVPKETLGTAGILDRLKARKRANTVIQLYREGGDQRPIDQPGPRLRIGERGHDHELVGVRDDHALDGIVVIGGTPQHGAAFLDSDDPREGVVGA